MVTENLREDLLLVVELQTISFRLVERFLELLLLLHKQFLEGVNLLEVLLLAGPLLDELLYLLQVGLIDLDLVLTLDLDV